MAYTDREFKYDEDTAGEDDDRPMVQREPGRLSMALMGQDKALAHLAETINETRNRLGPISRVSERDDETVAATADSSSSPLVSQIEERTRNMHRLAQELRRIIDHTDL